MEAVIILIFCALLYLCLISQMWVFIGKLRQRVIAQPQGDQAPVNGFQNQDFDELPISQLGQQPLSGDTSDLGAVDVALKIKDLQYKEEQSNDWSQRAFYDGQIRESCELLVELTLLQVASPEHDEQDDFMGINDIDNIAYAAHRFRKEIKD